MKRTKINISNHKVPQGGYDNLVVRAKYLNDMASDLDVINPSDNVLSGDTIQETTSAAGVTVDGFLIKDSSLANPIAYTATVTGLTTGQISAKDQFCVITVTNTAHFVSLPLLSSVPTGCSIKGTLVNTGCRLSVHPTDISATKYINGVTGGNKLKLNNGTGAAYFNAVKVKSTKWIVTTWSSLGAPTTLVPSKAAYN